MNVYLYRNCQAILVAHEPSFETLQQAHGRIQAVVKALTAQVISLTCFPYLKKTTINF